MQNWRLLDTPPMTAAENMALDDTLLELKGKLGPDLATPATVADDNQADILQALVALGYSEKDAATALKALPPQVSVSDGIKLALKKLS